MNIKIEKIRIRYTRPKLCLDCKNAFDDELINWLTCFKNLTPTLQLYKDTFNFESVCPEYVKEPE